jgi:chromosome segregation ATPase
MRHRYLIITSVIIAILPVSARADSETDRLRDALRTAIAQTRALEDERAALQAKIAQEEKDKATLKTQVDAAKARATQLDKEYRQAVLDFNGRLEERNKTLEKWKDAYEEAATVARTKDAERAKFEGESKTYKESTQVCTAKNLKLIQVGQQIIAKYDGVTIGDIMVAKEPVFAFRRVEIQNWEQDQADKLIEQKVQPDPNAPNHRQ